MADLKQLKIKPRDDFGSDDPLAELTRIMGLAPQTAPDDHSFDDFGIDLERELLGDLGDDDSFMPPKPANLSLPADAVQGRAGESSQSDRSWHQDGPDYGDDTRWAAHPAQSAVPLRVVGAEPVGAALRHDKDDAEALERELGAYLEDSELFATPPAAAAASAFEPAGPKEPNARFSPAKAWDVAFAPAASAVALSPSDEQETVQPQDQDPFDRLAAMSRDWQQRRQAREAGLPAESAERPQSAAQPQPVSAAAQAAAASRADAALSSHDRVTPAADVRSAMESAVPHTPIRFVPVGEVAVDPAPGPVAPTPAPAAAEQLVIRQPQPQPATAATAVTAAPDGIFDPFAELAAMAEQSRSRASAYSASAPAAEAALDVAPVSHPAPAAEAAPLAAPATPAAAETAARHDAGAPAIVQSRPRTTPTSFQPAAERSSSWRRVDPVVPSAAPVATAIAAQAVREETFASAPESQEPVAEAPIDTWDAINAWAAQPESQAEDDRLPADNATVHNFAEASMVRREADAYGYADDDRRFTPGDAENSSAPAVVGAPLGEAYADGNLDLGSLLEAELAQEVEAPSWTSQSDSAAFHPAQPHEEGRGWQQPAAHTGMATTDVFADAPSGDLVNAQADADYGPEVDTVEVPLAHYEVAHDLDLPELAFEDETPPPTRSDELDLEFANAFEELAVGRPVERPQPAMAAASPVRGWSEATQNPHAQRHERGAAADVDDLDSAFEEAVRSWAETESSRSGAYAPAGYDANAYAADEQLAGAQWSDDLYDVRRTDDAGLTSAIYPGAGEAEMAKAPRRRRGLMVAALVAGVAVIGGIGAFALSFGDSGGSGAPVLVKADPDPVKVRPEQPGGVTIPNQDKAVYDRVATGEGTQPSQERLVSAREEPIDLGVRTVPPADTARVKSEERVDPVDELVAAPADDVPAIAPRRVRTMVVRPDGTLVPREEPAPQVVPETAPLRVAAAPEAVTPSPADADAAEIRAASQAAVAEAAAETPVAEVAAQEAPAVPAAAAEPVPSGAGQAANGAGNASAAPAAPSTAPVRVVETQTITRETAARQTTPERGPVAPSRPADQPVDIVNRAPAAQTQVAAAAPAPVAAAPTSEWSVQIASQPSPDGAQASYADLSRRYGSIIGGRGVNIVKADIAGKGTFWRVRIPAGSRSEANALCERYKSAGGSCFVAR